MKERMGTGSFRGVSYLGEHEISLFLFHFGSDNMTVLNPGSQNLAGLDFESWHGTTIDCLTSVFQSSSLPMYKGILLKTNP